MQFWQKKSSWFSFEVWFGSCLSDRDQFVDINGATSNPLPKSTGVPQGSTLGPFLNLLCINDIANSFNIQRRIHFEDDPTVLVEGNILD